MAGMDTRNSGRVLESSEAQLSGSTRPGNPGLEVWKWSRIPDLTLRPSHERAWPAPYHPPRHCAQSCGRPAYEQSSSPAICTPSWPRGASGHGWAKGNVYFYRGGNVVHHVRSLGRHPCHGGWVDDIVQSDVLLLSVLAVVAVDGLIEAIHQHSDDQFRRGLICSGHPLYLLKSGLNEGLCLLEALFRVLGKFRNPGQQPLYGHEGFFCACFSYSYNCLPFPACLIGTCCDQPH